MAEENVEGSTSMMGENYVMMQALWNIVQVSDDAEVIRLAIQALTTTDSGQAYIRANPLAL